MHVCLFDIDGTLLNSGGAGRTAMDAALQSEFGVTAPSDSVPMSGRTDRAIGKDLFALHRVDETRENWHRFVASYLHHLPQCLHRHEGKVLPGITWLLEHLSLNPRVAVGLLTGNLRDGARVKLSHYGLFHHFAFGAFGDHHLCRNEVACEAIATVKAELNGFSDPDRIWVIGDTPLDIACARAVGVRVAATATGKHPLDELAAEHPDLLFADLSDPAPLLARLTA